MNLNRVKKVFHFLGSVKQAVIVMLLLIVVVATGTIIESRYNADYARLLVYQSFWFNALIILLWFNILFATLTRWPWQRRHFGFLVTHLGLLLLFGGGFLTNVYGIDGTLRVEQGQSSNSVMLQDLVIGARTNRESQPVYYPVKRSASTEGPNYFSEVNEALRGVAVVNGYEPFVDVKEVVQSEAPNAASGEAFPGPQEPFQFVFQIKSTLFDVEQSLNSVDQTEVRMGPALFKLVKDDGKLKTSLPSTKKAKPSPRPRTTSSVSDAGAGGAHLNLKLNGVEKSFPVSESMVGNSFQLGSYKVVIKKWLHSAVVVQNTVQDQPGSAANPALEVEIIQGKDAVRDILYAKFANFSLRKDKFKELTTQFVVAGAVPQAETTLAHGGAVPTPQLPSGHPEVNATQTVDVPPSHGGKAPPIDGSSNVVIVEYSAVNPASVHVRLFKAGAQVAEKVLQEKETFTTPWMGMVLTAKKIAWNAQKKLVVTPIALQEKIAALPPSAILLNRYNGPPADEAWLVEGDERELAFDGHDYFIYYGKKIIELPFVVKLDEFKKTDYPGTAMAKEYESHVQVPGILAPVRISMNEPLAHLGYTVYQASYEQLPNGTYASIFSVNYDPGRPFKYAGGIILAIGIVSFTVSRSKRFVQWRTKK